MPRPRPSTPSCGVWYWRRKRSTPRPRSRLTIPWQGTTSGVKVVICISSRAILCGCRKQIVSYDVHRPTFITNKYSTLNSSSHVIRQQQTFSTERTLADLMGNQDLGHLTAQAVNVNSRVGCCAGIHSSLCHADPVHPQERQIHQLSDGVTTTEPSVNGRHHTATAATARYVSPPAILGVPTTRIATVTPPEARAAVFLENGRCTAAWTHRRWLYVGHQAAANSKNFAANALCVDETGLEEPCPVAECDIGVESVHICKSLHCVTENVLEFIADGEAQCFQQTHHSGIIQPAQIRKHKLSSSARFKQQRKKDCQRINASWCASFTRGVNPHPLEALRSPLPLSPSLPPLSPSLALQYPPYP